MANQNGNGGSFWKILRRISGGEKGYFWTLTVLVFIFLFLFITDDRFISMNQGKRPEVSVVKSESNLFLKEGNGVLTGMEDQQSKWNELGNGVFNFISDKIFGPLVPQEEEEPKVTLALVACGQKRSVASNVLVLIKSAILFSKGVQLHVIVFKDEATDAKQNTTLEQKLERYKEIATNQSLKFTYKLYDSSFPTDPKVDWRNMYMTCTTQRLFLPTNLPDVDAVIYLDADTVFLSPVKEMWDIFGRMNPDQVMGMISEHELPGDGWYNRKSKTPYYGPRGINGGVSLMNLTRLRKIEFQTEVSRIQQEYAGRLRFADQDILNIYFHRNPHLMYNVSCAYNFRKGHCLCDFNTGGSCGCVDAQENGAAVIHGNIWGFDKLPLQVIHSHFSQFDLATGDPQELLNSIQNRLNENNSSGNPCMQPQIKGKLLHRFETYLNTTLGERDESSLTNFFEPLKIW